MKSLQFLENNIKKNFYNLYRNEIVPVKVFFKQNRIQQKMYGGIKMRMTENFFFRGKEMHNQMVFFCVCIYLNVIHLTLYKPYCGLFYFTKSAILYQRVSIYQVCDE